MPDVLAGDALDVAANQRIAGLANSLCVTFAEERDNFAGQDELIEALDGVCNLGPTPRTSPQVDEQLDVAIAELRKMLDR